MNQYKLYEEQKGKEGESQVKDIYDKYADLVYGYLFKLSKDKELTEELLQETFYQAIRCADKYDHTCSVSTWLCSIAKNLWRKEMAKKHVAPLNIDDYESVSTAHSAETEYMQRSDTFDLMKRIHQLPEAEKEVVLLRTMGGLSYKDIGSVVGKSENWARVTFFRAKKKLRR